MPLWMRAPLWARWTLSLLIAAIVLVALVLFVEHHNNNKLGPISPAAQRREAREAEAVVGHDQAPHVVRLNAGASPHHAFTAAVRGQMRRLVSTGTIPGPLQAVSCRRAGARGGTVAYDCTARAADVNYPFVGVAQPAHGRLTFCKRDLPPSPSENIPVSARCRLPSS